jgi:hypothetical protein
LVEQRTENPRVGSSILPLATTSKPHKTIKYESGDLADRDAAFALSPEIRPSLTDPVDPASVDERRCQQPMA